MQYTAKDLLNFQDVVEKALTEALDSWRKNNQETWQEEILGNIRTVDKARRQLWNRICSADAVALDMDQAVVAFVKNLHLRKVLVDFLYKRDVVNIKEKAGEKKSKEAKKLYSKAEERKVAVGGLDFLGLNKSAVEQKRKKRGEK